VDTGIQAFLPKTGSNPKKAQVDARVRGHDMEVENEQSAGVIREQMKIHILKSSR
jgi:hypothetical protein